MTDAKANRDARRRAREAKVLAAMRSEGLITPRDSTVAPLRHQPRVALALAAGLLLTLSAGVIRFQLGQRSEPGAVSSPSVRMQQSGDAYVRALRELLDEADALDPAVLAQGREAALAVMLSGAAALSETLPDPAVAQAVTHLRASRGTMPHAES